MANISSYPLIAPKMGDLILFTETYDINAAAPVIGNPTRATTIKAILEVGGISGNNYYLDGITKSGETLTFSVSGATNQTYTFGVNAFNSTTIATNNNQLTNGAGYTSNLGIVASLTTVGTSGAATLVSGVLNVPTPAQDLPNTVVYTKTVTMTPAQLVAIDPADSATWIELVAAPGANKVLHLLESAQGLIGATVSYSSNASIKIGITYPIVQPMLTGTGTEYKCILGGGNNLMAVNTAMTLNTNVQESTGDGTFKLYLRYRIIDLS